MSSDPGEREALPLSEGVVRVDSVGSCSSGTGALAAATPGATPPTGVLAPSSGGQGEPTSAAPRASRPRVERTEAEQEALRAQLREFYEKYNPSMLKGDQIQDIIDLGIPDAELFARMRAKYDLESDDEYTPHPQIAEDGDPEAVPSGPVRLLGARLKDHMARKYSSYTTALLVPVSITILIVVWAVTNFTPISRVQDATPVYLYYKETETDSGGEKFAGAVVNALIIVAFFCVVTFIMVMLYKYRCMRILGGWLMLSTATILYFFGWVWFDLFCTKYQIPYDKVSVALILWNFGTVGVLCIYYRGHPVMKQAYLIASSAITAWFLSRLPEWTTWVLLAAVALYDVFAVLSPTGPLKALVEESEKRDDQIPGIVYESKQYKLGLGDFVFYSVLVGRAAKYAYLTWVVCMFAVLAGLCGTLFTLGVFQRALPALPFSIALGITLYFTTRYLVVPYAMSREVLVRAY